MKGYKAFEKGMVCLGFQYEVGKTFEHKDRIVPCSMGFHFCENPLDVLNHYPLVDVSGDLSEFAEVEALGETKTVGNKSVTNQLRIGEKLDLPGLIKASFEFLWGKCAKKEKVDSEEESRLETQEDYSQWAASGDYSHLAASGFYSHLSASGDDSRLAASGHYSQLVTTGCDSYLTASGDDSRLAALGDDSQLATSGDYSRLLASGDNNRLASSGYGTQFAASGNNAQLAASGDNSRLTALGNNSMVVSSGDDNRLALNGKDSVGAAMGIESRIRGKVGNWITLAEWKHDGEHFVPICVKSAQIDGKKIKQDTWYELKNGRFTEVRN
ncbi:hypothetical protein [Paenibacillus polymyxa]|uniref:DUF7666 domain-containing protein n=1 Tax=Paenibacillus polymyxa (strain SC2) TaxID=886882 RepID=E3EKB5_PAEPS|nr:hypothetical protein [Paenibacillus polymyxa]ADO59442.1 hypothetical protein PPSC2_27850 [Paenibacillus polymyxa SC2]WPQ59718.1 hypothetical protein SKN87_29090 [Paenibacillus polymyxa]